MNCIQAPDEFDGVNEAVFLAGGVTPADNWQAKLIPLLSNFNGTVINPRRESFPDNDANESKRQIEWEYRHMHLVSLVVFWFPPQTDCPMTLFELGVCCASGMPLVVGTDVNYSRRLDVVTQCALRLPGVEVVSSLNALADAIINHPSPNQLEK